MQTGETLKPTEPLLSPRALEGYSDPVMITKEEVLQLYDQRKQGLESIRGTICRKFYYTISEKLEQEKKLFERILHIEDTKQEVLSRYSFVLNPYYFEQKFFRH